VTDSQPQQTDPDAASSPDYEPPQGDHVLEIAAREGFGPLSPQGREVWHGNAKPCVSCGHLVPREAEECHRCGQDLSEEMMEKMVAHSGPWYVKEHVRPFPGVSLERIIRQIRRGVIEATSVVRGPETNHQWRFAAETPGLCRFFGRCWNCHAEVAESDEYCTACLSDLCFKFQRAVSPGMQAAAAEGVTRAAQQASATGPALSGSQAAASVVSGREAADEGSLRVPQPEELRQLSAVVKEAPLPTYDPEADAVPRIAGIRPFWFLAALLVLVIVALVLAAQWRSGTQHRSQGSAPLAPAVSVLADLDAYAR
jgi:RNA polymerase subunit RPABC4/transcription elongation factor Spt4